MDRQTVWSVFMIGLLLLLTLIAGSFLNTDRGTIDSHSQISLTVCEDLNGYDFEQMLRRVETIKEMELERNLTICTEQTRGGIDTTSAEKRFAYLREPGLSFFELSSPTDTGKRSSIGYTTTPLDDDPIKITLASESVVKNVSWTSYEALIVHELSHAVDNSHLNTSENESTTGKKVYQTTDWLLANQAISEGSAIHVSNTYAQKYDGALAVSELGGSNRSWKHRTLISVYSSGYRYSKSKNITSSTRHRVNSTAQVLHPKRTNDPGKLPARPNLTIESLEHVRTDRVGELFLREVLYQKNESERNAITAAKGWKNDRLDIYRGDDFDVVTWRVVWQSKRDRSEFLAMYDSIYEYTEVDSLEAITCESSDRYLVTKERTVSIVLCSS